MKKSITFWFDFLAIFVSFWSRVGPILELFSGDFGRKNRSKNALNSEVALGSDFGSPGDPPKLEKYGFT